MGFKNYLLIFAFSKVFSLKYVKEEKSFFYFMKLLSSGSTVLDIGANVGYTSIILAKYLKKGQVFSFEPVPVHVDIINTLISIFRVKNIKLFEFALGDSIGKIDMVMPIENAVRQQGLSHVVHDTIQLESNIERFEVDIKTLDYLEPELAYNGSIDGMKIDIENFEFYALKGGIELITKYKPIIYCELWENENRVNTFELLNKIGYQGFVLDEQVLVRSDLIDSKDQNFFFIHSENNSRINLQG